jgi:hypothetical protein
MTQPEVRKAVYSTDVRTKLSKSRKAWAARNPEFAKESSRRMKESNPMRNQATRAKVASTLRRMGHKPKFRGGNGTGPTDAERSVMQAMPESIWNFAVKTGGRNPGFPNFYKVDLAWPEVRIALEVDGPSHSSLKRQSQDRKKETKLKELGWCVLRCSNEEAMSRTEDVVQRVRSTISKSAVTQATS